jgi:hypothetical protein
MNRNLKSAAPRIRAALPRHREMVYYALQRTFGNVQGKPYPHSMRRECARLASRHGFPLDPEFRCVSELLCTTVLHVLSRPRRQ